MGVFAKSGPEWTPLKAHLQQVASAAIAFANHLSMDADTAEKGALLHDIGKAHPVFQKRLCEKRRPEEQPFRHEIASLFFLSAFPKNQWNSLIEMVVSHHKSLKNDAGKLGLLDLEEESDYVGFHLGNWDEWSQPAFEILRSLGLRFHDITIEEAKNNLEYCVEYCEARHKTKAFSEWKGLLMGADHFASALIDKTETQVSNLFTSPDLKFYNRQHLLYPLSFISASSPKKHTIVVAPTGAGKTDFLLRRCKGRVFYTLPFQASINAMFRRIAKDLEPDNPELDIRVLHSTSKVIKRKKNDEEVVLQSLIGSSIKILTPHQLAALAFGMNGYEALLLDLRDCDIILDEVHTYTDVSQAIVLKLVEILVKNHCRVHIGTATMPTVLYDKIKALLGNEVYEVQLPSGELDQFDRHTVHKIETFEESFDIIATAVAEKQKILVVLNKVKSAQEVFEQIREIFPDVPSMLLHSRFKRGDRNQKEKELVGLDEEGNPTHTFNTSDEACIVVSTQIVEVSLDISFDVMITECAPLDALIQRFGRINRKRSADTIGKLKPVYVIAPPENEDDAKPYSLETLIKSYEILENGAPLHEREIQQKIDRVFTDIDFTDIEEHSIFKTDGSININFLVHTNKSVLLKLLEIDSVSCITEGDQFDYENGNYEQRLLMEIPTFYWMMKACPQSEKGNRPFIIPDAAYSPETGLNPDFINKPIGVLL